MRYFCVIVGINLIHKYFSYYIKKTRWPGIGPGSQERQSYMIPLHYQRLHCNDFILYIYILVLIFYIIIVLEIIKCRDNKSEMKNDLNFN